MLITIIGFNGFIGRELANFFKKKKIKVFPVTRKVNFLEIPKKTDVIIHAANTGKKFLANKNPKIDRENSINLTKKICKTFPKKKIILISTISVRTEKNSYSKNRKICETIIANHSKENLIFRLPVLFNLRQKKGILYDMCLNKRISVNENTFINPVTLYEAFSYILKNLNSKKIIHEIGSYEKIKIKEFSNMLNSKSIFQKKKVNLLAKPEEDCKIGLSKILKQIINFSKKC